jgi:hypothetical protein
MRTCLGQCSGMTPGQTGRSGYSRMQRAFGGAIMKPEAEGA